MFIYILLSVIFFVFGIIFALNKGDFILAGLNTSDDEVDSKKINRIWCITSFIIFAVSFIGIFVNSGYYMLGVIIPVVVLSLIISIIQSN